MRDIDFFNNPSTIAQKQYEAVRMYVVERKSAKEVASKFGYTRRGFTSVLDKFRDKLKQGKHNELFFKESKRGRERLSGGIEEAVIGLRKLYYSIEDIKVALDAGGISVSEKTIYNIIRRNGFARLPRRTKSERQNIEAPLIKAEKTRSLSFEKQSFKSSSAGILALLPYIKKYGLDEIIQNSDYPGTKQINTLSSILSFVALKASDVRRYTVDDKWCMDRGKGLFAGLNVLPKAAWFSSYSHKVTSDMNLRFLQALHQKWLSLGLLSDTSNLDFTTIPYWGENDHLENNWSGKRTKALPSMLAVLAQDPDNGIINYGNTNVMHKNESNVVLEFLDFYRLGNEKNEDLKYLIFDSKFTNYENLAKLDDAGIKFITIRRRGKNIVNRLENLPKKNWKKIQVERAGNKKTSLKTLDEVVYLRNYNKDIRQVSITGHGKIKPATIITNDFDLPLDQIVRKYARRWLVEKGISEQIEFFHLNRVSSSMVIKVDFDLTMSILTHNIFRLFAMDTERYFHTTDQKIYDKFLENSGEIVIGDDEIRINLKKKRNLPQILQMTAECNQLRYPWLNNLKMTFSGATNS